MPAEKQEYAAMKWRTVFVKYISKSGVFVITKK